MMQNAEGAAERAADHASDLFRESEYELKVSKFLTPKEKIVVRNTLLQTVGKGANRCFFFGGCRGTERTAAVFLPEWLMDTPEFEKIPNEEGEREAFFAAYLVSENGADVRAELPITAVRITGSGFKTLSHRDFMGSILSLGIERNMIGDILVRSESEALVFAVKSIVPYILSELKKIGRDGVRCAEIEISPDFEAERTYEELTIHVSSMRLDGIVSQLTGESRSVSAEMIVKGLVDHNYFTAMNTSAEVKAGDILSVRGVGKFVVGTSDGTTRSGRLRVHCRRYV